MPNQKSFTEEVKNEFVRIPITKELITNFFTNGEHHFEVKEGLTEDFECIGCVQDPLNAMFYLMFKKGQPAEGMAATNLLPVCLRLNEKFIEKEKVREAIRTVFFKEIMIGRTLRMYRELLKELNLEEK